MRSWRRRPRGGARCRKRRVRRARARGRRARLLSRAKDGELRAFRNACRAPPPLGRQGLENRLRSLSAPTTAGPRARRPPHPGDGARRDRGLQGEGARPREAPFAQAGVGLVGSRVARPPPTGEQPPPIDDRWASRRRRPSRAALRRCSARRRRRRRRRRAAAAAARCVALVLRRVELEGLRRHLSRRRPPRAVAIKGLADNLDLGVHDAGRRSGTRSVQSVVRPRRARRRHRELHLHLAQPDARRATAAATARRAGSTPTSRS